MHSFRAFSTDLPASGSFLMACTDHRGSESGCAWTQEFLNRQNKLHQSSPSTKKERPVESRSTATGLPDAALQNFSTLPLSQSAPTSSQPSATAASTTSASSGQQLAATSRTDGEQQAPHHSHPGPSSSQLHDSLPPLLPPAMNSVQRAPRPLQAGAHQQLPSPFSLQQPQLISPMQNQQPMHNSPGQHDMPRSAVSSIADGIPLQGASGLAGQSGSFQPSSSFAGPDYTDGNSISIPIHEQQRQQQQQLEATDASSKPAPTAHGNPGPGGVDAASRDGGEVPRRKSKNWTKASIAMQAMRRFARAGEQGRARKSS